MAAPNQAKVTSTEALDAFRSAMIVFATKAKRSLDDCTDSLRRTRQWIQQDQRVHWEGEYRRRRKALEQAESELMSARLANNAQSALMSRQMVVSKAQRDIAEAEAKLRKLKSWSQNFDPASDPIIKRMDQLRHTLMEYQKAIAYLAAIQKTLDAYAESGRPAGDAGESISSMAAELGIEPEVEGEKPPATEAAPEPEAAPDPGAHSSDIEPLPQIEPPPGRGDQP